MMDEIENTRIWKRRYDLGPDRKPLTVTMTATWRSFARGGFVGLTGDATRAKQMREELMSGDEG